MYASRANDLMFCEFTTTPGGCKCKVCGRIVRGHDGVGLTADCRSKCVHLGASMAPALVQCETCRGRVMLKVVTNACEVYGRCLPGQLTSTSDGYHLCQGCPSYDPRQE